MEERRTKMSKQADITQVELVEIANAILTGCYREIEKGFWSGGPGACYFPAVCCVYCSYKEHASGHVHKAEKHDDVCIVRRAQKIINESLPPATHSKKSRKDKAMDI
jgi:hypothetical protein